MAEKDTVKCPKEVDIEAIIKEVMKDKNVDPEEIPEEDPEEDSEEDSEEDDAEEDDQDDQEKVDPQEKKKESKFNVDKFMKAITKGDKSKWSRRYFRGRAYGQFVCDHKLYLKPSKNWSSAHAWCILDLKEQKVEMKVKQKCSLQELHMSEDLKQLCLRDYDQKEATSKDYDGVEPCFEDIDSVKHMVEWAVNLYLYLVGRLEREHSHHTSSYTPTAEHKEWLCEMCKRLGRPCVERK